MYGAGSAEQRLGLIIPKVVGEGVGRVEDPETRHYEHWMRYFGFPGVRTVEAFSEADGRHNLESVFDTGREDKLVAAARELDSLVISSATRSGVQELLQWLAETLAKEREEETA